MKTVKSGLFKKYFKGEYRGHGFLCPLVGYI